jgi:hypothetical protein
MSGPGRTWDTEPRWRWVEIRVGGRWQPGQVERWHLCQGSTRWMALISWGPDGRVRGWYLYDPATVRRTPRPSARPGGVRSRAR